MPDADERQRLSPGQVATRLFGLAPDRDERAPQLCQEALLTLALNDYEQAAGEQLRKAPKRERFALRSLALGTNFLAGRAEGRAGDPDTTPQLYGERLAKGEDMRGSAELGLARQALEGLIDPDTRKGQPGGWLLFPFHESLLWCVYSRRSKQARRASRSRMSLRNEGVHVGVAGAGGRRQRRSGSRARAVRARRRLALRSER